MEQKRHHDLIPQSQMHQLMTGDIGRSTTPPGPKLERPNVRGVYPNIILEQPTMNSQSGRRPRSEQPTMGNNTRPELRQEPSEEVTRKS